MSTQGPPSYYRLNQMALSNSVRTAWAEFASWTFILLYAILFGTHDPVLVEQRLHVTADTIGALFVQFFGGDAGEKLSTLLKETVSGIARMAEAYRDNNASEVLAQHEALYRQADEMAALFSQLSRYWDAGEMQAMLYEIFSDIEKLLVSIAAQDSEQVIQLYDELIGQVYKLSEELVSGLAQKLQF